MPEVNKEALAEAIAKAEEEADKTDVYTAESIAALEEAIADAKEVYGDESAEQEQVDAQVAALEAAIEALVKLPEPPQTYTITASAGEGGTITPSGEVTVNVGEAQTFTIKADEGWHIKEVIINGESVGAEETYTMEAAGTIEALFEKDAVEPEVPDKSALEAALKEAAEILAQTDKYTEESLKDYKAVVDEAQAVYDDAEATAEEIADAVQKLTDARDLLKEIDKEEPGTGDKPGTGTDKPGTGSGNGADKAVQTGDNTSPILWIVVLAAACVAAGSVVRFRTKKTK